MDCSVDLVMGVGLYIKESFSTYFLETLAIT